LTNKKPADAVDGKMKSIIRSIPIKGERTSGKTT
jgi:hypothetical protein